MKASTIRATWLIGMVILLVGLIVAGVSMGLMFANGGQWIADPYVRNNWTFYPSFDSYFWTTLTWMIAGFVILVVGLLTQLVAWVGALVNTYRLADKMWFLVLLIGGLVGISFIPVGWAAMIAYLVAQPDANAREQFVRPPLPTTPQEPERMAHPEPLVPMR